MRYGSLNNIDFKMNDVRSYLASIDGALGRNGMAGNIYAIRQILESGGSTGGGSTGGGSTGGGSTGSLDSEQLFNMLEAINDNISHTGGTTANNSSDLLQAFYELQRQLASGEIGGGGGGGDGGGSGGDKPCKGPLCDFTKPSPSSGSALSKVFSDDSIEDIKKRVENKDNEITAAMDDVKSVFAPKELTISGTYNNDYHDINGVRVDLSGKSNMELFFNSGPKMAIWFLAVLIAFSVLMGGRKNA